MDFAKNLLKKYGWNEGDGLGKKSDGITKPLKANLKFDKAGLGVDKASEFSNHWWERVFNNAASNIDISKEGESIKIDVKDKDSIEITTKEYSVKKLKNAAGENGYNNFLKKSILSGLRETKETSDDNEPEEPDLPKYKALTDEELYAACGGRTAHKGARHGLKLTGKLKRIEQQERELLTKIQSKETNLGADDWMVVSSKKKRKQIEPEMEAMANNSKEPDIQEHLYINEYNIKSTKKKKKHRKEDKELSSALSASLTAEETSEDLIPKKKEKRKKEDAEVDSKNDDLMDEKPVKRKKRSKDKLTKMQEQKPLSKEDFLKSNEPQKTSTSSKKKKK